MSASRRSYTVHMGLCVRGALMNWSLRDFRGLLRKDDGTYMEPTEAKAALLEELAQGHEVLPYGACDNWDWKIGCKGHESSAVCAPETNPDRPLGAETPSPTNPPQQSGTDPASTHIQACSNKKTGEFIP